MGLQEFRNRQFILFRREGAGGIHQPSAGSHQLCAVMQDFRLTAGAHLYGFDAPVGYCRLFLAKHAFTGAGRIDQHLVELPRKTLCQHGSVFVGYQRIRNTHPFHILG